MVQQP
jgi:hypothetical protein